MLVSKDAIKSLRRVVSFGLVVSSDNDIELNSFLIGVRKQVDLSLHNIKYKPGKKIDENFYKQEIKPIYDLVSKAIEVFRDYDTTIVNAERLFEALKPFKSYAELRKYVEQ